MNDFAKDVLRTSVETPLISVIMGVYYRRDDLSFLERSVRSIQEQTFPNFEFLICDDGSTQQAQDFLDACAHEDDRIRLIRGANLYTLPKKLNACLLHARGRYVARMDDDDWSDPLRFEMQLQSLKANPEIAFVGCNVEIWQGDKTAGVRVLPAFPTVKDFLFVQPFIHPSLMFRSEVLRNIKGYSEAPSRILCEDYDLLLRIYERGLRGINLDKVLLRYTIPEPGVASSRKMRHRFNEVFVRWQHFSVLGLLPAAFPYVLKPVVVGLLPEPIVRIIRKIATVSVTERKNNGTGL